MPFSSIKPSMTNHVNSKTVYGKIICFMCACANFSLLFWNFLLENFLYWRVLISFFGGGYAIFFHKAINDQSCNSKTVYGKIICFMCACANFSLLFWNFLLENFLSVQVSIKAPKKCLLLLGINSVKV